jgi:hypothetical protein
MKYDKKGASSTSRAWRQKKHHYAKLTTVTMVRIRLKATIHYFKSAAAGINSGVMPKNPVLVNVMAAHQGLKEDAMPTPMWLLSREARAGAKARCRPNY